MSGPDVRSNTSPALRFGLGIVVVLIVLGAVAVWLLPVGVFQNWNAQRAGDDPYAVFEAVGQAEALAWAARIVLPLTAVLAVIGLWDLTRLSVRMGQVWQGFLDATDFGHSESPTKGRPRWRTMGLRIGVLLWLSLFAVHAANGVLDRGRDWAYFRLRSGNEVLPNISFENRHVIRYVREATPEDARIFVCSDQSPFFLSYYLRPRRVFHRVHPDAEFVIPKPGQTRPLAAYRLEDLPEGQLEDVGPDFVLEYFEGADYVDDQRLDEDPAWNRFWRASTGTIGQPSYMVVLRPIANVNLDDAASAGGIP